MGAVAARWHHEPASGTETASSRPRPPAPARNVRSFGDCGAPSGTRAAAAAAAAHTHTHTHLGDDQPPLRRAARDERRDERFERLLVERLTRDAARGEARRGARGA